MVNCGCGRRACALAAICPVADLVALSRVDKVSGWTTPQTSADTLLARALHFDSLGKVSPLLYW